MPAYGWGPLTAVASGPLPDPANSADLFDTGMKAAQVLALSATVSIVYSGSNPGTAWDIYFYWYDASNVQIGSTHYGTMTVGSITTQTASITGLSGAHRAKVQVVGALAGSDTITGTGNGSFSTDADIAFCEYGTRLKSGIPSLVALTPSILLTIGGLFTRGWRQSLIAFFAGRIIDAADLCGQAPPAVPEITPGDFLALTTYVAFGAHQEAVDKFWTWIQAVLWPQFCECIPGTPPPTTYTGPDLPTGTDLPTLGPNPCDNSDICALLMQTQEDVEGLYGMLSMIRSELQALQSQSVPFSYVTGTLHSGLTGQGEFSVSGILGLSVEFTSVPPYLGRREDDPLTYYGLAEIGLGTDEGWLRSQKCSHNPQLILPIGPEITRVAYTLAAGAEANILELVRRT